MQIVHYLYLVSCVKARSIEQFFSIKIFSCLCMMWAKIINMIEPMYRRVKLMVGVGRGSSKEKYRSTEHKCSLHHAENDTKVKHSYFTKLISLNQNVPLEVHT